jgi:tRNA G18 (ribose-2'-O)-methylase SpoU
MIVALPPMHSNVNVARIVRAAGCCGITQVIACGRPRLDAKIARDSGEFVTIHVHRSLPPVLGKLAADGYRLVGLEQATQSRSLYEYQFTRRTALIVGNERLGITEDVLRELHEVVEIPIHGRPLSHNAATAAAIAMFEYCRQFPHG